MASTTTTNTNTSTGAQTNTNTNASETNISNSYISQLAQLLGNTTSQGVYQSGQSGATYSPEQLRAATQALLSDVNSLFNANGFTDHDYGILTDRTQILDALNAATNSSFNQQRTEANQALRSSSNLATQNNAKTIQDMRNNLQTSALNGANAGQVNANILSAYLSGQQANAATQTEALQQLQNIAEQRRDALNSNAQGAITTANSAAQALGTLLNEEKNGRVAAAGSALYNMGSQAGSMAGATSAKEWGNTANNAISTTTPYKTTTTTQNGAQTNKTTSTSTTN